MDEHHTDGGRRFSCDIAPEDVYRALARMQNANEDLEFMIDDSLAAKEHSSLSLFSGALTTRKENVKRKLRMLKHLGKGAGKAAVSDRQVPAIEGGSKTPEPKKNADTALVAADPARGALTPGPPRAPGALPDVRGGSQKSRDEPPQPRRPLVNIGTLCSQIRREQQLLLEGPSAGADAEQPEPLSAVHPPAVARALLAASSASSPGAAHKGALVPLRITTRKLRPVVKDVSMREKPPDMLCRGKVNYEVLLQEQQEMNKRRLEHERAYDEMLVRFEAYQAKLLQMLPAQSVFGNRLTDEVADVLDAPAEPIDRRIEP